MRDNKCTKSIAILVLVFAWIPLGVCGETQRIQSQSPQAGPVPANATHCDISIPVHISLVPLNISQVGSATRFQVNAQSSIDPDLVRSMRVEYEVPERMRRSPALDYSIDIPPYAGENLYELGVIVPDEARYRIRARLVVQLVDGKIISQTATRWIDLGKHVPEDMVGKTESADGVGIRIYRGVAGDN